MHESTLLAVANDRLEDFRRQADASRRAALARSSAPRRHGWLSRQLMRLSGGRRRDPQADGLGGGFGAATHAQLGEDV